MALITKPVPVKKKSRRGSTKDPIDNYQHTEGYNQRYFQRLDARIRKLEQAVETLLIETEWVRRHRGSIVRMSGSRRGE